MSRLHYIFCNAGMGIMQGDELSAHPDLFSAKVGELFPSCHFLKRLKEFEPVYIRESQFPCL